LGIRFRERNSLLDGHKLGSAALWSCGAA
jgi:hypothetical protein